MAIEMKQLLKLAKLTKLIIKSVSDDSSEQTQVKVLHLLDDVVAVGSIPLRDTGDIPQLKGKTVHVAADNIEEFMKDAVLDEAEGIITYEGPMYLDVSKPKTRNGRNGELAVIAPAKIWLTKVKFNKSGAALQQNATTATNAFMAKFFGGGKIAEVGSEDLGKNEQANGGGEQVKNEPEPVVIDKVGS